MEIQTNSEAEKKGFEAFKPKGTTAGCEYKPGTPEHADWMRGWAKGYLAHDAVATPLR